MNNTINQTIETEFNTESTKEILCPYCGDEHDYDPFHDDYDQNGHEQCLECRKIFKYEQELTEPHDAHLYTVYCPGCMEERSHEDFDCDYEGGVKKCEECGEVFEYDSILEVTYTTTRIE